MARNQHCPTSKHLQQLRTAILFSGVHNAHGFAGGVARNTKKITYLLRPKSRVVSYSQNEGCNSCNLKYIDVKYGHTFIIK